MLNREIERIEANKQAAESERQFRKEMGERASFSKEKKRCAGNILHWFKAWVWTYDPRLVGRIDPKTKRTLSPYIRFLLWPKQAIFVLWVVARIRAGEPWLLEKSRDQGATYLLAAICLWFWLFTPGFKATFGSRDADLVDSRDNPDSIFEKLRIILRRLPTWMLPVGFDFRKHDTLMQLTNPETGATITGEAGDNMGRGGRAQPLTAKVLTQHGWRTMGDIQPGDMVIGGDGRPVRVSTIHPQGEKQIFRVTFSDGATTQCCDDHLWQVTDRAARKVIRRDGQRGARHHVLRMADLRDSLLVPRQDGQTEFEYRIPMAPAVQFAGATPLPLNPYLIGSLLGDGGLSQIARTPVRFTTADAETVETLRAMLPIGHEIRQNGQYDFTMVDAGSRRGAGRRSDLKQALFDLGMDGQTAATKSIPAACMTASVNDRLELLRGLLDTDGWVGKRKDRPQSSNKVCFSSISARLAADVVALVQSLGGCGVISIRAGKTRTFPQGHTSECQDAHQVTIAMPPGMNPFRLSRKASLYGERTKYQPSRSIVSVEPVGVAAAKCITVEAADGLYLTDDFIVTHNCTVYVVDEAAFVPRVHKVEAALSGTTDCVGWVSTVNPQEGMGNFFARKRHTMPARLIARLYWRDDPRKNDEWAKNKQAQLSDPLTWEAEYEINYTANAAGVCIPAAWVRSSQLLTDLLPELARGRIGVSGGDVGGGKALSVVVHRFGPLVLAPESRKEGDTDDTAKWMMRSCAAAGSSCLNFDSPGIGAGVLSTLSKAEEDADPEIVAIAATLTRQAVNTGVPASDRVWPDNRTSEEMFGNLKAELWWLARQAFQRAHFHYLHLSKQDGGRAQSESEIILLPSTMDGETMTLVSQLSLPKYRKNDKGKIVLETKEALQKRSIPSPDHADAFVLSFLEPPDDGISGLQLDVTTFHRENPMQIG